MKTYAKIDTQNIPFLARLKNPFDCSEKISSAPLIRLISPVDIKYFYYKIFIYVRTSATETCNRLCICPLKSAATHLRKNLMRHVNVSNQIPRDTAEIKNSKNGRTSMNYRYFLFPLCFFLAINLYAGGLNNTVLHHGR